MKVDQADPVVRYAALAVLVCAFAGAVAVAVHGYWLNVAYQPPALVAFLIGSAVTTAAHVLGIQSGNAAATQALERGAKVAMNGHNTAPDVARTDS